MDSRQNIFCVIRLRQVAEPTGSEDVLWRVSQVRNPRWSNTINSHVLVAGSGDSMPRRIGGVTSPPAIASECCRPVIPAVMMPRGW
jgi:hypothetical protein